MDIPADICNQIYDSTDESDKDILLAVGYHRMNKIIMLRKETAAYVYQSFLI